MTTSTDESNGLIIFLRFPERGKVKSRLAETLGHELALKIYQELTALTLQMAIAISIPTYLFYAGGLPEENERNPSLNYLDQSKGELGEKIVHALRHVLQRHQKAIIIGSDCPSISMEDIRQAMDLLDIHDIVLGPSSDGGYYLLGCKKINPLMFESIDWSTDVVLRQTINKIEQQGESYALLRTLADIDTEEDWIQYKSGS